MIPSMTRLFILFLIALLPLRGWSVQSMVFQMGAQTVAVQAPSLDIAMGEDCALHMQQAAAAQGLVPQASDASHKPEHKGCQSCQLCMPLAALAAANSLALVPQPQAMPSVGSSRFVSAERARDVKPPIS